MKLYNFFKKPHNSNTVYIFLFALFCLFRFQESIFKGPYSAAMSPDGYCSVGGFQILLDQNHESGKYLFSDVFRTEKLGSGIGEPGPFSILWKMYFYILGTFFDAFDINVYSVFIIALINGLSFYLFTFIFTRNPHLSFLGTILITSFYNYHIRINGHLFGLGSIFFPIVLLMSLVLLSQKITLKNIILFCLSSILTLNMNEYYGFFGFWISFPVLVYIILSDFISKRISLKSIIKFASFAIAFQSIFLLFLYPTIIREKIFNKLAHLDTSYIKGISHPVEAMMHYSIKSFSEIFTINRYFHQSNELFENYERTYYIGVFIFLFILINLFLTFRKMQTKEKRIIISSIIIFITSILLCLHPQLFPSLVKLNAKIAPMFRVTFRSLVYFDIISVFVFLYTLFLVKKYITFSKNIINTYLFITVLIVLVDLPYPSIFDKVKNQTFPSSEALSFLKNEPNEYKIVEVPFYPFTGSAPEKSYLYIYNYYFHRKSILNFPFAESNNPKFITNVDIFAKKINEFTDDSLTTLNELGVKIIIFNKKSNTDVDIKPFKKNANLEVIYDDEDRTIFKINNTLPKFNTKNIVFDYLLPKDKFFDYSNSCSEEGNGFFNCSTKAKIRFFNYLTQSLKVQATIEIEQSKRNITRELIFELPSQEFFETSIISLAKDQLNTHSDMKVKVELKQLERVSSNANN